MAPHALLRTSWLPWLLSATLAAAPAAAPRADEGDDQALFLAGLAEKGLFDVVVREGEAFLRRFPDHPKRDLARYRLAAALFELDRTDEALPHLRALASVRGFELAAEVQMRLGQCALAAGDPAAARAAFDACAAEARRGGADKAYLLEPARFLSAEAALQAGDPAAAEPLYLEVLAAGGEYAPAASAGAAWCAWRAGAAGETARRVRRHLERFGAEDPHAAELGVLLGEALLKEGDARAALEAFRAVRGEEHREAAARGAAFALGALGEHAAAAAAFERLLEGPYAAEAALFRGVHLLRAGEPERAVAALRHPAAAGPEAACWRAEAELALGRAEDALATADAALRARPDEELARRLHLVRGDALSALGRGDEAVRAYDAAGSDYALSAGAVAALNAGDHDQAARLAEALLERFPASEHAERARVVLGEARFAAGDHAGCERALAGLDTAARDAGLRARAAARLAWCRYLQDDFAGAAQRFAELARALPDAPEAEEAAYMAGRALEEQGDRSGAARAWAAHLAAHPGGAHRAEALAGLVRCDGLDAAARHAAALAAAAQADAGAAGALPRALLDLGERASAEGRLDVAREAYRALLERAEGSELRAAARYGLGWCLLEEGRAAEAAAALDGVAGEPGATGALAAAAAELAVWAWRDAGEPQRAAAAWRAFAPRCDDGARVLAAARTAAHALRDAGAARDGLALLEECLRHARTEEVALQVLVEGAFLALDAGDVDRAEAQVAVAARRAPESPDVLEAAFFVAEARHASGRSDLARALYRRAAEPAGPRAALALYKLGFLELEAQDPEAAEEALARLVTQHPDADVAGEGLFLLAEARFRRGAFQAAAADLERLRAEHPRHEVLPKALFRLGAAYGELGRFEESAAALAECLKLAPRFENLAEAELLRGRALSELGRGAPARQALRRVLALEPDGVLGARAHLALGRLSEREGDREDALSAYLKVAVLYAAPEEVAEALFRAGECLAAGGRADAARERWQEAARHAGTVYGALAAERLGTKDV